MTHPQDLKTPGLTPCSFHAGEALFHVSSGVPIREALSQASDLLHIAKRLAEDATMERDTDRHAWASYYLQAISKALIDDVVKVLE